MANSRSEELRRKIAEGASNLAGKAKAAGDYIASTRGAGSRGLHAIDTYVAGKTGLNPTPDTFRGTVGENKNAGKGANTKRRAASADRRKTKEDRDSKPTPKMEVKRQSPNSPRRDTEPRRPANRKPESQGAPPNPRAALAARGKGASPAANSMLKTAIDAVASTKGAGTRAWPGNPISASRGSGKKIIEAIASTKGAGTRAWPGNPISASRGAGKRLIQSLMGAGSASATSGPSPAGKFGNYSAGSSPPKSSGPGRKPSGAAKSDSSKPSTASAGGMGGQAIGVPKFRPAKEIGSGHRPPSPAVAMATVTPKARPKSSSSNASASPARAGMVPVPVARPKPQQTLGPPRDITKPAPKAAMVAKAETPAKKGFFASLYRPSADASTWKEYDRTGFNRRRAGASP